MDQFSKDFGGLHSPDDFDLLSLGLVPGQEEQAETADQDEPRINPSTIWTVWSSSSGWSRRRSGRWPAAKDRRRNPPRRNPQKKPARSKQAVPVSLSSS